MTDTTTVWFTFLMDANESAIDLETMPRYQLVKLAILVDGNRPGRVTHRWTGNTDQGPVVYFNVRVTKGVLPGVRADRLSVKLDTNPKG